MDENCSPYPEAAYFNFIARCGANARFQVRIYHLLREEYPDLYVFYNNLSFKPYPDLYVCGSVGRVSDARFDVNGKITRSTDEIRQEREPAIWGNKR